METTEEKIEELQRLIINIKSDEETFGLAPQDIVRISAWKLEIKKLKLGEFVEDKH